MKREDRNEPQGFPALEAPFVLAPMAGVTDGPFRSLCRAQGAALVYSEMVSAKGLWFGGAKSFELLRFSEHEKPIAFQIFGNDPEIMAAAAERLSDEEHAAIDINMGCPVTKVAGNGEGSALMKTPELAGRIVESVCAKSGKPVSVKIRAGWSGDRINAVSFAKEMEAAGAAAIGVHARTREQYYSGKADWGLIARVKNAVGVPVFGSGDVMSGADAVRMLHETGCDAVMIARGALGNPWIFRDARLRYAGASAEDLKDAEPTPMERARVFRTQALQLSAEKGAYIAVREMRKHAGWYFRAAPHAARLRARVNTIDSFEELLAEIDRYCRQIAP